MATVTILLPRNAADTTPDSVQPPAIFQANRSTLSEKSGYFRSQIRAGLTIMIAPRQVPEEVFEKVLKFLEDGSLAVDPSEMPAIVSAAYSLDVPSLVDRTNKIIQDTVQRRCTVFQEYFARSFLAKQSSRAGDDKNSIATENNDVAACDGPVKFEKVPNDAMHQESAETESSNSCPECLREFKTQHCLERHKKRHIIPVSGEGLAGKRNVKFFPCKLCGKRFPTYYFVQKHRRTCIGSPD